RGRGDDILRVEGINLGGHADITVADIIAAGYPYDQWAGHFYQAMTQERFVKLGIEAARLGLRVNCVVSRNLEYALSTYEAIDKRCRSATAAGWSSTSIRRATRRSGACRRSASSPRWCRASSGWRLIATASTNSARRPSRSGACSMAACPLRF